MATAIIRPARPLSEAERDVLRAWTAAGSAHWPEMRQAIVIGLDAITVEVPYELPVYSFAKIIAERAGAILRRDVSGQIVTIAAGGQR